MNNLFILINYNFYELKTPLNYFCLFFFFTAWGFIKSRITDTHRSFRHDQI